MLERIDIKIKIHLSATFVNRLRQVLEPSVKRYIVSRSVHTGRLSSIQVLRSLVQKSMRYKSFAATQRSLVITTGFLSFDAIIIIVDMLLSPIA